MNEPRGAAKCADCQNRTPETPHFCRWLQAFLQMGLTDDPECEGFTLSDVRRKSPGKKKAEAPMSSGQIPSSKGSQRETDQTKKAPSKDEIYVGREGEKYDAFVAGLKKEGKIPDEQASQDVRVSGTCPSDSSACPKNHEPDKELIQTALSLKALKGSIVLEKVRCGKCGCHKCQNGAGHGPYLYLHFYHGGRVKRKYLSKRMAELLRLSKAELEGLVREAEGSWQGSPSGSRPREGSM